MNTDRQGSSPFIPDPSCFEITDEKFKELFKNYRKMIEETSLGKTGLPPCIAIHYRQVLEDFMPGDVETALLVVDQDFNDATHKQKVMKSIGRACFQRRWVIVAACMASEAWMSTQSVTNPDLTMMPSKDPNRKECIAIQGRTMCGEIKIGYMIPLGRDTENKFFKDGETISTEYVETCLLNNLFIGWRDAIKEFTG